MHVQPSRTDSAVRLLDPRSDAPLTRTDLSLRGQRQRLERSKVPPAADDLFETGRLLVVAPHPDDEVLGAGGTIARLSDAGAEVVIAFVTRGAPPLFSEESEVEVRAEARAAHEVLGVDRTMFLDHPAAQLDGVPHHVMNRSLGELIHEVAPDTLLLPFVGDIHLDHQLIFLSSMVAARPNCAEFPKRILCYETVSETNWHAPFISPTFVPNVYVDISAQLERKIEAMRRYGSQQRDFPHERSLAALRALAIFRGTTVHREAAEAFMLVRQVI
jgi:LmbE family N-acetylglucosaminyl deacetylase